MSRASAPGPEFFPPAPDLFRALELAHYARRFRGQCFVVALPSAQVLENLLLDLKVLLSYQIQVALVLPQPTARLKASISRFNRRGLCFDLLESSLNKKGRLPGALLRRSGSLLAKESIPIVFSKQAPREDMQAIFAIGAELAWGLNAAKLFLVSAIFKPLIAALPCSHLLAAEIRAQRLPVKLARQHGPLLEAIRGRLEEGIPDIILIDDRPAQLFQEVFSHVGAGVLFNTVRSEVVRQARLEDVTDIVLLLRSEIAEGRILPTDENRIERNIHLYWTCEMDGLLVGSARLKPYGHWGEVAQFTTLPRYRGKGHARLLAARLEQEAGLRGIRQLFALSTNADMWRFLTAQGYDPIPRERLPAAWRRDYNMARSSKAFAKYL